MHRQSYVRQSKGIELHSNGNEERSGGKDKASIAMAKHRIELQRKSIGCAATEKQSWEKLCCGRVKLRSAMALQREEWRCNGEEWLGYGFALKSPALLRKSEERHCIAAEKPCFARPRQRMEQFGSGEAMISNALYEMQRRRAELHRVDKKFIGGKKR